MLKIARSFGLLLLIISLSSCVNFEEVKITGIKSVKLLEFSDKGLLVESEIQISNPNGIDLSVVDSNFDVYVKDKKLARAFIDSKLEVPKNSNEYHKVVLKSDYKDLANGALSNMMALTMGSDQIRFRVDGFIVGKAFFIRRKVKVSHEATVPLKLF